MAQPTQHTAAASAAEPRRFKPTRGTLITLLMASMLNCMGGAAVAPALPQISAAFPESPETMVAFVVSLPALAVAISGFFVGALADRIGKAKTLVGSLVLFTLAGLGGLIAPSLEWLLVSRFIMGIGIAGVSTATTALIADYYDPETQTRVLGLQSASAGVSILTLETVGGFLALLGWRVPFFVYAIGIPMIVCALLFVREAYEPTGKVRGGAEPPSFEEASAEDVSRPDVPKKKALFSGLAAGTGIVVALCLTFAFFNQFVTFLGPSKLPYVVTELGGSTATSGLFLGASGLANVLFSLAYAPLVRRVGRFWLVSIGFTMTVTGCLFVGLATSLWAAFVGILLMNSAVAFVLPLVANWLAWIATPQTSGKLMGANAMLVNLGQFCCPLWSGAVLANGGTYGTVFIIGACIAASMVVVAIVGRIVRPRLQNLQSSE